MLVMALIVTESALKWSMIKIEKIIPNRYFQELRVLFVLIENL